MDSHRLGLDGIRLRCRAFRVVPPTTSHCGARFLSTTLRSVAVVWSRTHRGWCSAESILQMASLSTNPDHEPGPRAAPSYYDSGCTYIHVSGISRDRNGDLSDFSSRLCAFSFWK